ncbi:MAG: phosphate/phosphite/phosphonate ABC transporter substrate-binding protein [Thiolinea sp.]
MIYQMTVSPDFPPAQIAGWYIFNTWLQRQLDIHIHLELYPNFAEQRAAIENDQVDLIFANPFDASMLVREKGFTTIAVPSNRADEVIIASKREGAVQQIEDLQPGARIAHTDDPDVNMIGMIMLEPAELHRDNTEQQTVDSYPLVAKQLLQGKADVGFFLDEAFDSLSRLVRGELRELIRSQIFVIRHVMLAGPRLEFLHEQLTRTLLNMQTLDKGANVLQTMNLPGWEAHSQEDTEFMIDLMDTLVG